MKEICRENLDFVVTMDLNDILVYSESFTDHLKHLEIAFEILRKKKLFGKLYKCACAASEVEYLGHIFRRDGVPVYPHKVDAIKD